MGKKAKKIIETIIFSCKWILIASYIKLTIILVEVSYLFIRNDILTKEEVIHALEAVDIVMIVNLVKSIISGSYNSFVSKDHGYPGENVSSGTLKVKIGTSLIGISSIFLLQIFMSMSDKTPWELIWKYIAIHAAFLVGTLVMSVIEFLHVKAEWYESDKDLVFTPEDAGIIDMHDSPSKL